MLELHWHRLTFLPFLLKKVINTNNNNDITTPFGFEALAFISEFWNNDTNIPFAKKYKERRKIMGHKMVIVPQTGNYSDFIAQCS
jgi:hypothetical protein